MASSENDELITVCDRILVLSPIASSSGRSTGSIFRSQDILAAAFSEFTNSVEGSIDIRQRSRGAAIDEHLAIHPTACRRKLHSCVVAVTDSVFRLFIRQFFLSYHADDDTQSVAGL